MATQPPIIPAAPAAPAVPADPRAAERMLIARYLTPRTGEDLAPPTCTITLTKRQVAFLIDAIAHFEQECCPLRGGDEGCQLLSWSENPATGAIDTACAESCTEWRRALIEQVAPQAFGPPNAQRFVPTD